jgi:5-methylcytosine-specific restriction endonuclease McrA
VFGAGRFALATRPLIARGLHAIEFLVIEPRRGQVLASAADKGEVLAQARALILDAERQGSLWPEHEFREQQVRPARMPSRRRREIFSRSRGRCHYCSTPLQLAGAWHADHQQPRALDGADDALNLVATCPACNLAKRDRTALEFIYAEEPQRRL